MPALSLSLLLLVHKHHPQHVAELLWVLAHYLRFRPCLRRQQNFQRAATLYNVEGLLPII